MAPRAAVQVYIGGKQKRGDWEYTRPVIGHKCGIAAPRNYSSRSGAVINQVAEGNRKDIRDAVACWS